MLLKEDIEQNMTYVGEVSIEFIGNSGKPTQLKIKNEGLPGLFKILAQALIGSVSISQLPMAVDLRGVDPTKGSEPYSLLKRTAPITGRHIEDIGTNDEPQYISVFNSMISGEYLNTQNYIGALYLYICSDSEPLARILVSNNADLSEYITLSRTLLIEWSMRVDNTKER